jgi:hypothetical protein
MSSVQAHPSEHVLSREGPVKRKQAICAVTNDALEFPDGQVVLLTRLCESQRATVLQLPAAAHPATAEEAARPEVREPALLT